MFKQELLKFLKEIQSGHELDEWYLSNFVEENIYPFSEEEAFSELNLVIKLIYENIDSVEIISELMYIYMYLQRQSDTTEIPSFLSKHTNIFSLIQKKYKGTDLDDLAKDFIRIYHLQ